MVYNEKSRQIMLKDHCGHQQASMNVCVCVLNIDWCGKQKLNCCAVGLKMMDFVYVYAERGLRGDARSKV